ncbi:MAG: hypothetical protein ACRC0X_06500 [Brevinema sp.]
MKIGKIIILLMMSVTLHAQSVLLEELPAYYYNDMFDITSEFELDVYGLEGKSDVIFSFTPTLVEYQAYFTKEQQAQLLSAIQKYKEWRTVALKNKVEHTKDIVTITFNTIVDNTLVQGRVRNPKVTVRFVSGDLQNHFLYFVFHEARAKNLFLGINPDPFFLDYQTVLQLETLLNDLERKTKQKLSSQQEKDALFQ